MRVSVSGLYNPILGSMMVTNLFVLTASKDKDFIDSDGVYRITSIAFIIDLPPTCGGANPVNLGAFQRSWLNRFGGSRYSPTLITMEDYFSTCSYGKVNFSSDNNIIAASIPMPCEGVATYGTKWSTSTCGADDFYGWFNFAEQYAKNVRAHPLSACTTHCSTLCLAPWSPSTYPPSDPFSPLPLSQPPTADPGH